MTYRYGASVLLVGILSLSPGACAEKDQGEDELTTLALLGAVATTRAGSSNLYLFSTRSVTATGNMGGRAGADLLCSNQKTALYSALACTTVHAFISLSSTDEVRAMPELYAAPTAIAVRAPNGSILANNWAELLGSDLKVNLHAANVTATLSGAAFWSFTGSQAAVDATNSCSGGASTAGNGIAGNPTVVTAAWYSNGAFACTQAKEILCLCY